MKRFLIAAFMAAFSFAAQAEPPTGQPVDGLVPVVSASAESSHVLKAANGNLHGISVTTGATAGFVMIFDAASAPSDGAVTPDFCYRIPATTTMGVTYDPPAVFGTGITVVFSDGANCFTKQASATAFFAGAVK